MHFNKLIFFLNTFLPFSENTETKLPLLWWTILKYSLIICHADESTAAIILHNFAQNLINMVDTKGPSGWGRGLLNAIGLNKQNVPSITYIIVFIINLPFNLFYY